MGKFGMYPNKYISNLINNAKVGHKEVKASHSFMQYNNKIIMKASRIKQSSL
jgi:hypothetical protein